MTGSPELSRFAASLGVEGAFEVLAEVRRQQAAGKDVVELEIGDSPFPAPAGAVDAVFDALGKGISHYCPSPGIPDFRAAAAEMLNVEFGIPATAENIIAAPGAKPFQQFFCEAFLNPGDGALVFSPHFSTYPPNIERRGARCVLAPLLPENGFRPTAEDVQRFLATDPSPKAVFLNSPHNPTGSVMSREDVEAVADVLRGTGVCVFSDEPYCHMVWSGRHHSIAAVPGMLPQCMAAYTFSKSYSMSGWRLGFCVAEKSVADAVGRMVNSTLSCTPPFIQLAGTAALRNELSTRDQMMRQFRRKVELLTHGLNSIEGFTAPDPAATFYVFPDVRPVCERLQITSHGLAMFLLQAADDQFGIACLGGECFGVAGSGFLRFSCAEPDERLQAAVDFIPEALQRTERLAAFLEEHPHFAL